VVVDTQNGFEPLYRIAEVAKMLHISRASVYNLLRGERIVDLGGKGRKGVKLVPASVLHEILERKTKTFR
jgi:NADH:ubiquinone oxidoreductase subunit E